MVRPVGYKIDSNGISRIVHISSPFSADVDPVISDPDALLTLDKFTQIVRGGVGTNLSIPQTNLPADLTHTLISMHRCLLRRFTPQQCS